MIRQRFDIFAGVGPKSAAAISQAGIRHWADFLGAGRAAGLPPRLAASVAEQIRQFCRALDAADLAFINRQLPRREHWCLYEAFAGGVRYLDIETTGLAAGRDRVTVVGVSDGTAFKALVLDRDLTRAAVEAALGGCQLLVTYYGSAFDVPFLRVANRMTRGRDGPDVGPGQGGRAMSALVMGRRARATPAWGKRRPVPSGCRENRRLRR